MAYLSAAWSLLAVYWPAVVAVLLPFVVALIARCSWSSAAKGWTAFGLSVVVGIVGAFAVMGVPPPTAIATFALAVFGGCQTSYLVFRKVGITSEWLDRLLAIGNPVSTQ